MDNLVYGWFGLFLVVWVCVGDGVCVVLVVEVVLLMEMVFGLMVCDLMVVLVCVGVIVICSGVDKLCYGYFDVDFNLLDVRIVFGGLDCNMFIKVVLVEVVLVYIVEL